MIVIGTAGHIDHGKSAIVKRLTGRDPDRLPEEKARGMTIDLGFAFYRTPDNDTVALVDVPGHERFVKNMIAGAGGIDAVMLVIAADDGWMPQSEEHFQITRLLGTQHGLIVINKIDLAELDWLELLEADIREKVAGSFLADAPIMRVSAETGQGFDELSREIADLSRSIDARRDIGKARLCIDRSFIRQGIGGVVTGTLRGGPFAVGQSVAVWPSRKTGKIRTLQSNNQDVETAQPGQRTAVSLTGIDKTHLSRGGVISSRTDLGYFASHPVLALSLELLINAPVTVRNRRRALIVVGTTEVEGELRLMSGKELIPGNSGVVFFRPDDPTCAFVGDRYVLRLPTPMVTLGGGAVLDHLQHFPRQRQLNRFAYLEDRAEVTPYRLVVSELQKLAVASRDDLLINADFSKNQIKQAVSEALSEGVIAKFGSALVHPERVAEIADSVVRRVEHWLQANSHERGMPAEMLLKAIAHETPAPKMLADYLVSENKLTLSGDLYNLPGRGVELKGMVKQAYDEIVADLTASPYEPPRLSDLAGRGKIHQKAIKFLIESGDVHKVGADFLFTREAWDELVRFIVATLNSADELKVADLREKFGLTRKYGIPILEETDRLGLTERSGDIRIKGSSFAKANSDS